MQEGRKTGGRKWFLFGLPLIALVAVLASGCFVLGGTLFISGNDSVFVGLARNALKNAQVVEADVEVKFYDGDTLLSTKVVRICTRTLQSDDGSATAPFKAVLKNNKKADRVETRVLARLPLGKKDLPDLDVNNLNVAWIGSDFVITGDLENDGDDLEDVKVCAAMLDDDGNVLNVGEDDVGDIDEDDDASFEITIKRDSDAEEIQIWVDGEMNNDVTRPVKGSKSVPNKTATPTRTPTPTNTPTPTSTPTDTATPTETPT